jgi:serine/threonine protein kinase
VRLGVHTFTGMTVAVKVIDKSKLVETNDRRRVGREIRVLKRLTHMGIIKLFEVVDAPENIYVVMEYADGGSLLDYVRSRKRLDEREARHFLNQVTLFYGTIGK